jgi:acetolactate synthase I/III small subunit
MNRILTVIVNNRMGVLNRVTGLFLRRGFNIQSITVGPTETEGLSRMTIVLSVDSESDVEQVIKQLHKQVDVLKIHDISDVPSVARELALIKVHSTPQNRAEVTTLIDPFRASIIDVSRESVTVQVTGSPDKVEALIMLLRPYGIKELARTGVTAFTRDAERTAEVAKLFNQSLQL